MQAQIVGVAPVVRPPTRAPGLDPDNPNNRTL